MEIAALILSIIALIMAGTNLVIYLAKHVFSQHTIQMVPADSIMASNKALPLEEQFVDFDAPSALDEIETTKRK